MPLETLSIEASHLAYLEMAGTMEDGVGVSGNCLAFIGHWYIMFTCETHFVECVSCTECL